MGLCVISSNVNGFTANVLESLTKNANFVSCGLHA